MKRARAIAARELASYFRTPAGWIIVALYLFLAGLFFMLWTLVPGKPATMRDLFMLSGWLLLPVAPAITMRLIADELRTGTMEGLLTSPVGAASIVAGKFMGACAFLAIMSLPTLVHVGVLFAHATPMPDTGPILAGYLCLALLAGLYLSIGVAASSVTGNATLAFMLTFFTILGLLLAPALTGSRLLPGWGAGIIDAIAFAPRIGDFARGVVGLGNIVYFLSISGVFLLLAIAIVELRRWR